MSAQEGTPSGRDGGRRASFARRLPRLRVSLPHVAGDASAPASPVQVVVHVDARNTSKAGEDRQSAGKPRATTAPGHCERCRKSFSMLRRASDCSQCARRVCSGCLTTSSLPPPASPPAQALPSPPSPSAKVAACAECARISAFERQLSKSFFSTTPSTKGKRARYPGLACACYHQWFLESCDRARCQVRATEKKRARVIRKLRDRQLLHSPRWTEPCQALHRALATSVCYVSVASGEFELIVGSCGDMLHFSCFPREIGMCDQVLGASEPVLVLNDITGRTSKEVKLAASSLGGTTPKPSGARDYRHNPFLVLAKAGFFAARAIIVDGVGIGIVALLDPEPRAAPLADEELRILATACAAISERVTRIIAPSAAAPPRSPSDRNTAVASTARRVPGICAVPCIR